MLLQVQRFRERLDAVREGRVRSSGLFERTWARLRTPRELPSLQAIEALKKSLDRVGLRTVADAKLLRRLSLGKGRAGALATGLSRQAQLALVDYEAALDATERALLAGQPLPGATTALERHWSELVRICRTAAIFDEASPSPSVPSFWLQDPEPRSPAAPPRSSVIAAAEFFAERARSKVEDALAHRRDLDRAHELLLRVDGELERERMLKLRHEVAEARARVRESPPTRSLAALVREVRTSALRNPAHAYRSLHALYERAVAARAEPLAAATAGALTELARGDTRLEEKLESLLPAPELKPEDAVEAKLHDLAFELEPDKREVFELATGVARFFDMEEALTEEVLEAAGKKRRPAPRRVPYPTQAMTFEPTGRLDGLHHLVISDPRRILLDLASHQQLQRVFLEEEPPPEQKTVKRTAVRVYVLDASGSMFGPRARFRDALLMAELNNLRARARKGLSSEPLYYSYFNDAPTELLRVDSADSAARHIQRLFEDSPAGGQTDITLALSAAFDSIRTAQGRDPHLARATVVLVTDGEDKVDLELIRKIRAPINDVQIALSFVALGEENPDLKALAVEQREKGTRTFYQYLSDEEIAWAQTEFDTPWRTLLPPDLIPDAVSLEALEPHLAALEALAMGQELERTVTTELGFDALFPERGPESAASSSDEVARVVDVLKAIVEVASLAPAAQRASEAVLLLEHLRGVYGLTLPTYLAALQSPSAAESLARVRLLCAPL